MGLQNGIYVIKDNTRTDVCEWKRFEVLRNDMLKLLVNPATGREKSDFELNNLKLTKKDLENIYFYLKSTTKESLELEDEEYGEIFISSKEKYADFIAELVENFEKLTERGYKIYFYDSF